MKLILLLSVLIFSLSALSQTRVKGYYKSNGTYVQPHYRSTANDIRYDNYSAKGNYNPYTGTKGTKDHEFSGGAFNSKKSKKNGW